MSLRYVEQRPYSYPTSWDTTNYASDHFHAHLSSLERVDTDTDAFPGYPSVHKAPSYAEEGYVSHPREHPGNERAHHKVCFCEPSIGGRENKKAHKLVHENVDEEADNFIKSRHKCFGLRSWDTFKN
uniref:Uncharacterized protein n=1 Tax=Opuntia streptacantha TaxID=393608 RepID=A0A7C8ZUY0_OPUST